MPFTMPPEISTAPPRASHGTGRIFTGKLRFRNRMALLFGTCALMFLWGISGNAILKGKLVGLGLFGSVLIGPFLYASQREINGLRRLWRDGVLTQGTFTDKRVRDINQHAILNAAIAFRDDQGLVYEGKLIITAVVDPTLGDSIPVVYLPGDPAMSAAFTSPDHMEKLTFGPTAKKGAPA